MDESIIKDITHYAIAGFFTLVSGVVLYLAKRNLAMGEKLKQDISREQDGFKLDFKEDLTHLMKYIDELREMINESNKIVNANASSEICNAAEPSSHPVPE